MGRPDAVLAVAAAAVIVAGAFQAAGGGGPSASAGAPVGSAQIADGSIRGRDVGTAQITSRTVRDRGLRLVDMGLGGEVVLPDPCSAGAPVSGEVTFLASGADAFARPPLVAVTVRGPVPLAASVADVTGSSATVALAPAGACAPSPSGDVTVAWIALRD